MSRQNWQCLEPTYNSSYKSHTAEWHMKNWSLILLPGKALPALSRVWGRSRSRGLPKCAKMHLCHSTEQLWHQLGGEARLCSAGALPPQSGDLPLGPGAGGKWPSDNGVFKEVSQSQVDWEQESSWSSVAFSTQRNVGGPSCFQAGGQWWKQPRIFCWGRVANLV